MNRIDKLIIRAKTAVKGGVELTWINIRITGDGLEIAAQLWDQKPGSAHGRDDWRKNVRFDSVEDADRYIKELVDSYPPSHDIPVCIDCAALGGPLAPVMIGG